MTGKVADGITAHPTPWREVVLACRKCSRKLDGKGFGPDADQTLARALKQELGRERRRMRVVETKCLGICPRHAVSVVLARNPGEVLAVPAGTPAATVLARLTGR